MGERLTDDHCPACGTPGLPADDETYHCVDPLCDVLWAPRPAIVRREAVPPVIELMRFANRGTRRKEER